MLERIREADSALEARYASILEINADLGRRLVSFQANKTTAGNRWFKYKEGFSVPLMHYVFDRLNIARGRLLEPFAGSGTALFVARERGMDATGIELLPSSAEAIEIRKLLQRADTGRVTTGLREFARQGVWETEGPVDPFPHIRITARAFPAETEHQLGRYRYEAAQIDDPLLARAPFVGRISLEPFQQGNQFAL